MNFQALVTVAGPEEKQALLERQPDILAGVWLAPPACVADCPDPFYHDCPERAERDRQASLEFLHHLVMGPPEA